MSVVGIVNSTVLRQKRLYILFGLLAPLLLHYTGR